MGAEKIIKFALAHLDTVEVAVKVSRHFLKNQKVLAAASLIEAAVLEAYGQYKEELEQADEALREAAGKKSKKSMKEDMEKMYTEHQKTSEELNELLKNFKSA